MFDGKGGGNRGQKLANSGKSEEDRVILFFRDFENHFWWIPKNIFPRPTNDANFNMAARMSVRLILVCLVLCLAALSGAVGGQVTNPYKVRCDIRRENNFKNSCSLSELTCNE